MALHAAYFDESYGNEDAYSPAGYVATIEEWKLSKVIGKKCWQCSV